MNTVVGLSGIFLNLPHRLSITFRQAAVNDPGSLPRRFWYLLPRPAAILLYRLRHVLRSQETGIVCIHQRHNILFLLRHPAKLRKGIPVMQFMTHRLDHPKPHDIFQIAKTVFIPALIGEISLPALFPAIRFRQFHPHQRPCTGTDIQPVSLRFRHRHHRRGRIVTAA